MDGCVVEESAIEGFAVTSCFKLGFGKFGVGENDGMEAFGNAIKDFTGSKRRISTMTSSGRVASAITVSLFGNDELGFEQ